MEPEDSRASAWMDYWTSKEQSIGATKRTRGRLAQPSLAPHTHTNMRGIAQQQGQTPSCTDRNNDVNYECPVQWRPCQLGGRFIGLGVRPSED